MKKTERFKIALKVALIALAIACVAVPAVTPFTFADNLSNAKDQYSNTQNQINNKEDQLEEGKKQSQQLQSQIKELENKIYKTQAEINVLTKQLNDTKDQVNTVLSELAEVEERLNAQTEILNTRLRVMYKNGDVGMISVLLGSASMTELITNMEMVKKVYEVDAALMDEISTEYKGVYDRKEELVALKTTLEAQKAELDAKKSEMNTDKNQVSSLKNKVDKNNIYLENQIDSLKKAADDLKAEILKLQSTGKYTGGTMCWPSKASSRITSQFGNRFHPILKKYKLHTGLDIGAAKGTDILAANSGKVIKATYHNSYGYYVMIDHGGGIVTLYAHTSKLLVKAGDTVKRGQVIALVGSTGASTGPHLHFEVRVNGAYQQPLNYVTPGRYYYD